MTGPAFPAKMLQKTIYLHLFHYLNLRRNLWVPAIIFSVLAGIAIGIAGMFLTFAHPAVGEIFNNFMIQVFLIIVSVLAACAALVIAYGFWRSAGEITQDMPLEYTPLQRLMSAFGLRLTYPAQLPASTWQPISIAPDTLICNQPGEPDEAFKERAKRAINAAGRLNWTVVIPKGSPVLHIVAGPTDSKTFPRTKPPYQGENWTEDQRICPANARFIDEKQEEYQEYIDRFTEHFREWSGIQKFTADPEPTTKIILKALSALAFVLFFLPGLSGQKAAQVSAALGAKAADIPPAGSRLVYMFDAHESRRRGNGKSGYIDLLKGLPNYLDDGGGKFIYLSVNDRIICRGNAVQEVAEQPRTRGEAMRPQRASAVMPDEPTGFSMPDSAGMVEMSERAKYEIWKAKQMLAAASRPWWEVVMFAFWSVFPFLIVTSALSWLVAGVAAKEGMYEMHKWARYIFACIALLAGGILLINCLLFAMYYGASAGWLTVIALGETWIAYRVVTALVPDFRPAAGNSPMRRGLDGGHPMLNG